MSIFLAYFLRFLGSGGKSMPVALSCPKTGPAGGAPAAAALELDDAAAELLILELREMSLDLDVVGLLGFFVDRIDGLLNCCVLWLGKEIRGGCRPR